MVKKISFYDKNNQMVFVKARRIIPIFGIV